MTGPEVASRLARPPTGAYILRHLACPKPSTEGLEREKHTGEVFCRLLFGQ